MDKYQCREKVCSIEEADALAVGFTEKGQTEYQFIPFKLPELQDDEVLIKVEYTGICHTDAYWSRGLWGDFVYYPCVPGHEIVGKITKLGKSVTKYKLGDAIGFGFTCNCCGKCFHCTHGKGNRCAIPDSVTFHKHFGGWATHYVGRESEAHLIPKEIPLEKAANLFCAGVTVFAPMRREIRPGDDVGVVGIGGLGHLAIQFAHHMGTFVTGITNTPSKKDEIISLGADNVLLSEDVDKNAGKGLFDVIVCCISAGNIDRYIKLLKTGGTFIMVGLPPMGNNNEIDINSVALGEYKIVGSVVGDNDDLDLVLKFAAKYKIFPKVELVDFDDFPKGINRMENERPRYRVSVKCQSTKYPKFNQ